MEYCPWTSKVHLKLGDKIIQGTSYEQTQTTDSNTSFSSPTFFEVPFKLLAAFFQDKDCTSALARNWEP